MNTFFYVYILVSEADPTVHYTGLTTKLRERFAMHNRGEMRQYFGESALAHRDSRRLQL